MARMLGKTGQPFCGSGCCGDRSKGHRRMMKRRERQAIRNMVRKGN